MQAGLLLALVLTGAVLAAPTPTPPRRAGVSAVTLEHAPAPRHLHADSAVRAAFRRDEALRARIKYAPLLDDAERDVLRRDIAAARVARRDGTERVP